MTKLFNEQWQCPNCNVKHAKETLFKQWYRSHPDLESTDGFVVYDVDYIIHRFKTDRGREVQCLMFVEVKTFGAEPDAAQDDTLGFVNLALRNRRVNMHGPTRRKQLGGLSNKMHSKLLKRDVQMRLLGQHLLTFDMNAPQDSFLIQWDRREINEGQLVKLLRCDLDPDWSEKEGAFVPLDLRIHQKQRHQQELF